MANRSNINFNSIKVQLELCYLSLPYVRHRHFNSIKVQLELRKFVTTITLTAKFQFHKGTIRTEE